MNILIGLLVNNQAKQHCLRARVEFGEVERDM